MFLCEIPSRKIMVCKPCNLIIAVLDMARHIPLYRSVLQLLRAMALSPQLVSLLLPQDRRQKPTRGDELSVVCLLTKMKNCVDTYASRLK
jgi:baculoviral IAP repeat-containing protein 6